jgi:hypothetical protein
MFTQDFQIFIATQTCNTSEIHKLASTIISNLAQSYNLFTRYTTLGFNQKIGNLELSAFSTAQKKIQKGLQHYHLLLHMSVHMTYSYTYTYAIYISSMHSQLQVIICCSVKKAILGTHSHHVFPNWGMNFTFIYLRNGRGVHMFTDCDSTCS